MNSITFKSIQFFWENYFLLVYFSIRHQKLNMVFSSIFLRNLPLENFNSQDYNFKVNPDYYEWGDHFIKWTEVTRNTPGEIRKTFESPVSNIEIKFDLTINSIHNFGERNRLLITLVKLWKESGTILSTYVAETAINDEYKIVFFQRKEGQNVFVYPSVKLKINTKYRITFRKEKLIFTFKIEDIDSTEVIDHSPELIGVEESYKDIILTQGHNFTTDPDDSISGILEQLTIIELEKGKKEEEKPRKAFISFCHCSGNDFADHLDKCLKKNDIPTFYSDKDIRIGETWEEKIVESVKSSLFVVLIMTPGYDNSEIIRREISIALEYRKLFAFKHKGLDENHLCVELTSDYTKQGFDKPVIIDFNKTQIAEFDTKEDLFRKLYYELVEWEEGWFEHLSICTKLKNDEKGEYQIYKKSSF